MNTTSRRKVLRFAGIAGAGSLVAKAANREAADAKAFVDVFAKRQTVRRYKPDPVPEGHLLQILDAARRGPTCMNQQAWKFLVIRDRAKIEAMKKRTLDLVSEHFAEAASKNKSISAEELEGRKQKAISFTEGYFTAPVYVVVLVDSEAPCKQYALRHDGPIAASYLMVAARAFGYGTAYLTDGIPDQVTREVLAIPDRYQRICITPIGIPERWPTPQTKRKLEEMVAYETLQGHPPLERLSYNP